MDGAQASCSRIGAHACEASDGPVRVRTHAVRRLCTVAVLSSVLLVAGRNAKAQPGGEPGAEPLTDGRATALENPGFPPAYFYKPRSGRGMKPVFVYLHGRSNNPAESCRQWAKVVTEFGWLLCPSGQEDRGGGLRGWNNDPVASQRNTMGALASLRRKFGRKVQLYGNVLMGFSEGAFVAQNIGPRETKTFNRWLIIASCDRYFGYDASVLDGARRKIKRVYLWTGETDGVVNESRATYEHLRRLGVKVKLTVPTGLPHAIPADTMGQHFRRALRWLSAAK